MRIPCLTLLLLIATTIPPEMEQSRAGTDRVDALIETEMRRQRIPGLSLAVLQQGEIVKAQGYGVADRAKKIPATPRTVYRIASVSKLFIATGVMSLVQEGRIALDDPVVRFLDGAPAAWRAVTVRHLLSHTSGLVREGPAFDARKLQSDAEVIRSAYGLPLLFAPGERAEYSNLGYFVLAEIIRRASGQPWDEHLTTKIFRSLARCLIRWAPQPAAAADERKTVTGVPRLIA
jgi:CubicO group peptidase (beta-lactamase class C family)